MTRAWIRKASLVTRSVDGEAFIIADRAIENLTPLAASVWKLLARPRTAADIANRLALRFPGVDRARISGDVAQLISQLAGKGLIEPVNAPAVRKGGRPRSTAR